MTVVVQRPTDHPYPSLVDRLETALEDRTERELTVSLEFVDGATSATEDPQPSSQEGAIAESARGLGALSIP
ncbi:hypothetical protein C489_11218 [Natrinema versiforme JCM 10478]|uniref:Uncharacterized protein n=2 Tax=Natrinema versiforme TaxID=88724 RepID=L9XZP7_9EURY|nr:hypothetical protein C489_11218 [Natrinema versiforme JCM 10478]